MRRVIALVMLFVLPLHFVWAAAVPYWHHQGADDAHHFGHHFHVHQPDAHASPGEHAASHTDHGVDKHADHGGGCADDDACCWLCHLGAAYLVFGMGETVLAWMPSALTPPPLKRLRSVDLPLPERPDWLVLGSLRAGKPA